MKKLKERLKTNSLRGQLLSRFFLILIGLLIIIEIFQYATMKQYLYQSKEQILDARFHNIDMNAMQHIQTEKDVIENASKLIETTIDFNMSAAVIDVNGDIIAGDNKTKDSKELSDLDDSNALRKPHEAGKMQENLPIPHLSKGDYKKLLKQGGSLEGYRLVKVENYGSQIVAFRKIGNMNSPAGLIQLSLSAKPVQSLLYRQLYTYIIASLVTLIIGGILGRAVFKYTLKPLYNMTSTVEQINVGQLNKRLPAENGQIEIDSLSKAFNNMLERIETSFQKEQNIKEKMRQFVSDASHELRTPLTSIHGFVEVLLRGAAKNEKQLDLALNSILTESERLTKLVNDLLILTRLDQKVTLDMNTENLSDIINEIYPQLKILSGERKIELQLNDNIFVHVNRNQIKQVIFNLVQNAVRHTDGNEGIINITTGYGEGDLKTFAVLRVSDNGTGISKENISKIFDRFFRSESHRARKQGGYGLGLSIVKSIIDAHNGKIEVDSELGRGTTFSIYLTLVDTSKLQ